MSTSTPQKHSSKQIESVLRSENPRSQHDLKKTMQVEIGDQVFQFPSKELSRILSPKQPKPTVVVGKELLPLSDYDCAVDKSAFEAALEIVVSRLEPYRGAPSSGGEASHYKPFVTYLNTCVAECHSALDDQRKSKQVCDGQSMLPERSKRWYRDLRFVVGRTVAEGIEGAFPLKPDITGQLGASRRGEERLQWNPPSDQPTGGIVLPVEVKSDWKDLICQAATYARAKFSERPMQMFTIVLAFNHQSNEFRLLVFHRGGLAASQQEDIGVKGDSKGLEGFARLFLTLALWTTAEETGIVPCGDGTTYLLPADKEGETHVACTVKGIIFRSLCVRGRMTHILTLNPPKAEGSQPRKEPESMKPDVEVRQPLERTQMFTGKGTKPWPPQPPRRSPRIAQAKTALTVRASEGDASSSRGPDQPRGRSFSMSDLEAS